MKKFTKILKLFLIMSSITVLMTSSAHANDPQIDEFKKAAGQGNDLAQSRLGDMYHSGEGVTRDYIKRYAWINLAAANGDESAATTKNIITKEMTPTQIEEAQFLSTEYYEKYSTK